MKIFTASNLITHLQKLIDSGDLDKNAKVGKLGHFGEIHLLDEMDFQPANGKSMEPDKGWRSSINKKQEKFLDIRTPDIGEEPYL